ncbi:patatin-like phospholipase family protein [Mycolicibacterium gilvum]|uniref:Patatin n=2 Tax=Mycolicibacterium gilvum TaxID=1804 RepID=A0A378SRE4_9MYCO|nr:patatin-like phospholipase family protein [Mycolicibacterium gilvum]ABP44507.1 Patatin [Mycolicibacterium gilvum PYR-GCK]MCV7058434.1 patatin-like phospholipase family protein [Mycolicibacterium gilvum]STZ45181.1 patatin [Mycolicibacterium gilvum]
MSGTRALVLAGGGLAGIAWETGVLLGILEEAPEVGRQLLDSDVLVGTSAGSTVAAQLGSGMGLTELFERQRSESHGAHEIHPGVSIDAITDLFLKAMTIPDATREQKLQKIGAVAAGTDTVGEAVRRKVIEHRLPSHDWPARILRVTAIDIATGELVVLDASSGVTLVDAVAASCAVPGVWPPVTIGERRFMDGGVGSTVNMSAAVDCAAAVALVPSPADSPSPWGAGTAAEIEAFPGEALAVFADDDALAAFGPNPLDPACRAPAAEAGRVQGRREAARVADFLSGL